MGNSEGELFNCRHAVSIVPFAATLVAVPAAESPLGPRHIRKFSITSIL